MVQKLETTGFSRSPAEKQLDLFMWFLEILGKKSHESSFTQAQVTNVVGHMIHASMHKSDFIFNAHRERDRKLIVFATGAEELYKRAGLFVGIKENYGECNKFLTELGQVMPPGIYPPIYRITEALKIPNSEPRIHKPLYRQLGYWALQNPEPQPLTADTVIGLPEQGTVFRAGQIADWLLNAPADMSITSYLLPLEQSRFSHPK